MRHTLAIALAAAALGGAALPAAAGLVPPFPPTLSGNWTHEDLNIRIARDWHTLGLDHGRITSVDPTQITLLESDGTVVTVPLSPLTRITVNGRPAGVAFLRKRMVADTMRIDGGPAVRVRAQGPRR